MGDPVVHFAVYCDDAERAMAFYGAVFGWTFEAWGPPGYWKIGVGTEAGATMGALSRRTAPRGEGTPNAYRCTIAVDDLDATMGAIRAHGGTVADVVADIPGVGRVVEFTDPEGNLVCAMQYVAKGAGGAG